MSQVRVEIDTERDGSRLVETVYVPATLKMVNGRVVKEIAPAGESVIIFGSRAEADRAIREAGYEPLYERM
ncbi:MAG: hypothetical protein GMKNLPBB_00360 [Myxococcota bacterium]|nr:hypothetical protein [Myxococcota bacterium]